MCWFDLLKIKATKQWWEISRDDLALDVEIGAGSFGVVMRGYLKREDDGNCIGNCMTCAVKMLKGTKLI